MHIELDTSEQAARKYLRDWGGIETPGPMLLADAVTMLNGAEEALNEDPDVNAGDRAHELADDHYSALSYIKDTPELFGLDDQGLAGENPSAEQKVSAAIYALLSGIAAGAIEENRPSAEDMEWADAAPRPGYVLVGKSEDTGFLYVKAELRPKDQGMELSIVGDYRDGGGQIDMSIGPDDFEPAPDWTSDELAELWSIWDRWHLNGMKTACEHQQSVADRLGKKPHEVFTTRYGMTSDHYSKVDENGVRRITGNYGREPDGKQTSEARVHCMICDHDYGSTWLHRELPADVIEFIEQHFPHARSEVIA